MFDELFEYRDPIQSRLIQLDRGGKDLLWFEDHHWTSIVGLFWNPQAWAGHRHKISRRFFIHVSEPRGIGPAVADGTVRVTGIEGTGMLLVEGKLLPQPPGQLQTLEQLINDGTITMPSDLFEFTEIRGTGDSYFHLQLPTDALGGAIAAWYLAAVGGSFPTVEKYCKQETRTVRLPDGTHDSTSPIGPRQTRNHYVPTTGMRFYTEGDVDKPKPPCLVSPGTQSLSDPDTYEYETLIMKMYEEPT
jgi:hypothetical protein